MLLTPECQAYIERKKIYERLHPETKANSSEQMRAKRHGVKLTLCQPSFTQDTANKIKVEGFKPLKYNDRVKTEMILISEFAKRAGVSVQAVHKAMKKGRVTHVKRLGPIWLIHPSESKKFKGGK